MLELTVVLVAILVVRHFIWRKRYKELTLHLASLQARLAELDSQVEVTAKQRASTADAEDLAVARESALTDRLATLQARVSKLEGATQSEAESSTTAGVAERQAIVEPAAPLEESQESTAVAQLAKVPAEQADSATHETAAAEIATLVVSRAELVETATVPQAPADDAREPTADSQEPRKAVAPWQAVAIPKTPEYEELTLSRLLARVGSSISAALLRAGGTAELEELIGGNWLNKIGVAALVIGVALLTTYTLQYVGPAGKIALGVAISLAMLGVGVRLERLKRYMLFARPLIGGGWALLYFTAYAAHNFEASRIITSSLAGLAVLLAVAAGMIAHSLRYRSEVVTGVAYVLAFLAIDINPIDIYGLVACALLAVSLVTLFQRLAWYRLPLGAVIATYLTHFLWTVGATPTGPVPAAAFWTAESILIIYWLIFATCDFLRLPEDKNQRNSLMAVTVVNTAAFTGLSWLLVKGTFPDESHWLAIALAAGSAALSGLAGWRARLFPYRFYGLFGEAAATAAIVLAIAHWRVPGEWLAVGLGSVAALMLAAGFWRRESVFRLGAYLLGTIAVGIAVAINGLGAGPYWAPAVGGDLPWSTMSAIAMALVIGELLVNRAIARHTSLDPRPFIYGLLSAAFAFIVVPLVLMRWSLPGEWLAIGWGSVAASMLAVGFWRRKPPFRLEAYLIGMIAVGTAIAINGFGVGPDWAPAAGGDLPWSTMSAMAVAFVVGELLANRAAGRHTSLDPAPFVYGLLSAAFAFIVVPLVLMRWSLPAEWLGVGWCALALIALAAGLRWRLSPFRTEAYLIGTTAIAVTFFVNVAGSFPVSSVPGDDVLQWWTVAVVVIASFAAEWMLMRMRARLRPHEEQAGVVAGYGATILLGSLIMRDAADGYLGIVWFLTGAFAFELGRQIHYSHARYRGYGLMLAGFCALIVNNSNMLFQAAEPLALPWRWAVMATAAIVSYAVAWRIKTAGVRESSYYTYAAHAGVVLAALTIWNTLPLAAVAVAWGLLALLLREAGARPPEPPLRLQAYALAAVAWCRLFIIDFVAVGSVAGISTRIITVIPIAALLYYFRHSVAADREDHDITLHRLIERRASLLFSLAGTIALLALARFEFGRSDAVAAWSVLGVALLAASVLSSQWDYRTQAYVIGLLVFLRSWTTNFFLAGSFFGVPERVATTIPAIVMLFWFGLVWRRQLGQLAMASSTSLWHPLAWADRHANQVFCGLAVALTAVLIFYSAGGNTLTMAWTVEGLVVTTAGFLFKERTLRLSGLALLAICLLKGFIIDLAGVEPLYRYLSFVLLGAILITISFAYTRYRNVLRPYV
jgi:hypothetical protein